MRDTNGGNEISERKMADARDIKTANVSEEEAAATRGQSQLASDETDAENTARIVGEARRLSPVIGDDDARREMSRKSRRSFLIGGAGVIAAFGGWRWLKSSAEADGIPYPFRASHEFNRRLSENYFSPTRLAPEFPRSMGREPRVNGGEGMSEGFAPETWRLQVVGVASPTKYPQYRASVAYQTVMNNANAQSPSTAQLEGENSKDNKGGDGVRTQNDEQVSAQETRQPRLLLTMDDIRRLPRVEITTELKCIEGWSAIVTWAGARFLDFAAAYQPVARNGNAPDVMNRPGDLVRYVSLATPDGGYYVGLDMASALHPQTLLCYEMNGAPLTLEHGAPLRLYIPVKYGIKSIKRIGRIAFTDARPADFWAERGYDWYSGH